MTSYQKSNSVNRCDVKNNHAKFHADIVNFPIWNDEALGFFKQYHPKKKNKKMSNDIRSIPNPKSYTYQDIVL